MIMFLLYVVIVTFVVSFAFIPEFRIKAAKTILAVFAAMVMIFAACALQNAARADAINVINVEVAVSHCEKMDNNEYEIFVIVYGEELSFFANEDLTDKSVEITMLTKSTISLLDDEIVDYIIIK